MTLDSPHSMKWLESKRVRMNTEVVWNTKTKGLVVAKKPYLLMVKSILMIAWTASSPPSASTQIPSASVRQNMCYRIPPGLF